MHTMIFIFDWAFQGLVILMLNPFAGINCIYPSDLVPFTRRPLFLVIDGDGNEAFEASIIYHALRYLLI